MSLRELLGMIGAHEWRKKGVEIPRSVTGFIRITACFRRCAVNMWISSRTPLPSLNKAFDVGTGTGVLAALLAKRGVKKIVATDPRTRERLHARARIWRGSDTSSKSMWCKPICFRKGARRSSCAIRRGCRRGPLRRSNTRSTIRTAACCSVSSEGLSEHLSPGGEGLADSVGFCRASRIAHARRGCFAAIADAGLTVVAHRIFVRGIPSRPTRVTRCDKARARR